MIRNAALLLGTPATEIAKNSLAIEAKAKTLLVKDANSAPLVALVSLRGQEPAEKALEVLSEGFPSLGICVVADDPFTEWCYYRKDFAAARFERCGQPELTPSQPRTRRREVSMSLDHKFESILFECQSILRDNDGLHPDEALDDLCKIIGAKLADESYPAAQQIFSSAGRIADEIFAAKLRWLCTGDTANAISAIPRASAASLASVALKLAPWSFADSTTDVRGRAFQRMLGITFRAGLGQYFTPSPIVDLIVQAIDPRPGESLIDPFCGSGHFLISSLAASRKIKEKHARTSLNITGIDINERMLRVALTDMRLHSQPDAQLVRANTLGPLEGVQGVREKFDLVLTNPPFGSLVSSSSISQMGEFELARGKSTPLEILGLERSVSLLKPRGRIGIVLPEGILTNQRLQYVRDWIAANLKILVIVSFPREAFSPYGANIATCALIGQKRERGGTSQRDHRTMLIAVEDVGYDAAGRPTSCSDLAVARNEICEFLRCEGW